MVELWCAVALAGGLEAQPEKLARDLVVTVLHGYPGARYGDEGRTYPIGLDIANDGPARTLTVEIGRPISIAVPAGGRLRWFGDFTTDQTGTLAEVRDELTGGRATFLPLVTPTYDSALVTATLGSPPPVDTPPGSMLSIGALDAHVPDAWRRLAGLDVLFVGADPAWTGAGAHPAEWAVLRDWVLAGGVLVAVTPGEEPLPPTVDAITHVAGAQVGGGVAVGAGRVLRAHGPLLRARDVIPAILDDARDVGAEELVTRARDEVRGQSQPAFGLLGGTLCLYAMFVGPLGWWFWIQRRQQPGKYLLYTIGVSAGASLALVIADATAVGFFVRGVGAHLRIVDQAAQIEVDAGTAIVFAPRLGGTEAADGWRSVDPDEYVDTPLWSDQLCGDTCATAYDGICDEDSGACPGTDCTDCGRLPGRVLWTIETQRRGAPLDVRTVSVVSGVAVRPSTGALLVTAGAARPVVENHVGVDLEDVTLWLDGRQWHVAALGDGDQATAEPGPGRRIEPSALYHPRLSGAYQALSASPRDRYVARGRPGSGAPRLLASGFRPLDIVEVDDMWLVVGLL